MWQTNSLKQRLSNTMDELQATQVSLLCLLLLLLSWLLLLLWLLLL